jgi:hypothetical protein
METYPHLVSSQTPHILLYIYINNSQNIAGNIFGNIFANEQCHRKLMFSGDIELNPGPVFL